MRRATLLPAALLAVACAAPPSPSSRPAASSRGAGEASPLGPARYVLYDRLGRMWDEAGSGSWLPRPEPVIVDGARLMVDAGVIVASARHAERLTGFRSLPARLGGGFVVWSDNRVYRAAEFLGELSPVADAGASGARPWLASVLLRTPSGLLELDPRSLAIRRAVMPGVADAIALDERRAARLDVLGRASFTVDGGATWTDALATRGVVVQRLVEVEDGGVKLLGEPTSYVLGPSGDLDRASDVTPPRSQLGEPRPAAPLLRDVRLTSRALPGELLAQAVAYGALIGGQRIYATREGGVRVLAASTGLPVADADLLGVDARFSRCQPVAGSPPSPAPLLACVAEAGAAVLDLGGGLTRPSLEAAFPAGSGGFFAGPRGRLAYDGRCGADPPTSLDLGPGTLKPSADPPEESAPQPAPPPEPAGPAEPPPIEDARVCVRAAGARWVERRLRGDDARNLYRWVPGDDGAVTALVIAGKDARGGATRPPTVAEGVRVIRLDPDDAALGGALFPAVIMPRREVPYRMTDPDFWQDDDGAIRGWVQLRREGEEKPSAPAAAAAPASARRPLRVSVERGGRRAGVRIDAAGHVTVLPLPKGVVEVVSGGRFGLAMATGEHDKAWFETLDGGATWAPIEGPPVDRLATPPQDEAPFACSPIGCAWGSGMIRLGWGGPAKPAPAPEVALTPAASRRVRELEPLALSCRVDADEASWSAAAGRAKPAAPAKPAGKPAPHKGAPLGPLPEALPISLHLTASSVGALHDHTWTGEVLPPFQPSAALRRLSATDPTLHASLGRVVPVIGAAGPVDLLLLVDKRRLRAGAGAASFSPFDVSGRVSIAADGPDGALVLFDPDRGHVWLARGDAKAVALRLSLVTDAARSRLTLARRLAGGGLSLAGYSASSGDVFVGDLDLGRAEVGPLSALGRLDAVAEVGACGKASHRMLMELPLKLEIKGRGGKALVEQRVTAMVLVLAAPDKLCVEAVDAALGSGGSGVLRATLGSGGSASVWKAGALTRGVCSLGAK